MPFLPSQNRCHLLKEFQVMMDNEVGDFELGLSVKVDNPKTVPERFDVGGFISDLFRLGELETKRTALVGHLRKIQKRERTVLTRYSNSRAVSVERT